MKRILYVFLVTGLVSAAFSCASTTGRTTGQHIDDAGITSAVNMKIIEDPELSYLKINVDTFRGNVTLTGTVPSKEAENRLIAMTKQVKGVKSVKSNLIIQPPKTPGTPEPGTAPSTPAPGTTPEGTPAPRTAPETTTP